MRRDSPDAAFQRYLPRRQHDLENLIFYLWETQKESMKPLLAGFVIISVITLGNHFVFPLIITDYWIESSFLKQNIL